MKTSVTSLMEKVQAFGLVAVVAAVMVMIITGMGEHFFSSLIADASRTVLAFKVRI
jgi:hypothetical protein